MKHKVLLAGLTALTLFACQKSPEERAKESLQSQLHKQLFLNDSYEPIEMKLDSAFSPDDTFEAVSRMKVINRIKQDLKERPKDIAETEQALFELHKKHRPGSKEFIEEEYYIKQDLCWLQNSQGQLNKELDSLRSIHKEERKKAHQFIGFKANHRYRVRTQSGQDSLCHQLIIYDKYLVNIQDIFDLNDTKTRQAIDSIAKGL